MEEIIKYRQENPMAICTIHTMAIEEYRQLFNALVEYGHKFRTIITPNENLVEITIYRR